MSIPSITIEISPGELIDRITILQIKSERIRDSEKRARVAEQLTALKEIREGAISATLDFAMETTELKAVNESLWDIEDKLRRHEQQACFDQNFVELARLVYLTNDRRAEIKRAIDERAGSKLIEEKEYVEYRKGETSANEAPIAETTVLATGNDSFTPASLKPADSALGSPAESATALLRTQMQQGNACYERNDLASAGEHYRQALALQPTSTEANYKLGVVLADGSDYDEAAKHFRRILQLNAQTAPAWNFLGVCEAAQQRYDEAEAHYRRAIELQFQFPDAHFNLGQLLLRLGRLEEGFAESEWRWQTSHFTPLNCVQPRWTGSPLEGTLLVHTEQGAGDAMQFIRYIPLAARKCKQLILVCTENLAPLFASVPGIDHIRGAGEIGNHEFQSWIPLMSLPLVLGTTLQSIPCDVPYLSPPADREPIELGVPHVHHAKRRVGIAWGGSPTHKNDRHRSCSLSEFAPLFEVPDVAYYSLQIGPRADDISQLGKHAARLKDLRDQQRDFSDTAIIMRQLDLIISVDTAVLHLACALGLPTWGLLSTRSDWRWMTDREDSPWYPTLRLFRQQELDLWSELIERVAAELRSI